MRSRADAVPAFVWVPDIPAPGSMLALDEDAIHHVRRVCRARPGDSITLTDGRGVRATVVLESDGRVRVIDRNAEPAAPGSTVACGVPEGERADWLIEKLAELGVGAFQPIDTSRSRWRPERSRLSRWQRLARAALGQSQGAWLLEVRAPVPWSEFVASIPPGSSAWLADPLGQEGLDPAVDGASWWGAVGPAAGFDEREKDDLVAVGFRPIRLSSRRLRTETAAVGLAALWASTQPGPG